MPCKHMGNGQTCDVHFRNTSVVAPRLVRSLNAIDLSYCKVAYKKKNSCCQKTFNRVRVYIAIRFNTIKLSIRCN